MAVYKFSALSDGQAIHFDPHADDLVFDQASISAADVRVLDEGSNVRVRVAAGAHAGKDVLLLCLAVQDLGPDNVTFANGSRLVLGDDRDNVLVGSPGRDHLAGFDGDDTYFVTAGDFLSDSGGTDTVVSSVSWNLAWGFENLTLTGSAVSGGGHDGDNVIVGNAVGNILSGRGGDDTLRGEGGNDTFSMSNGGEPSYGNDVIDGGEGIDTIDFGANARSPVLADLSLATLSGGGTGGAGSATLASIENVIGGAHGDTLIGNFADNFFYGHGGNDLIDGGMGADSLDGAAGNDSMAGSDGNDTLRGGAGDDWLRGGFSFATAGEATGNDLLTGGSGRDYFVFNDNPNPFISSPAATADRISDFQPAVDTLAFDDNVFPGIGAPGRFSPGDERFHAAANATSGDDPSDRVVYNTSTGNLYYDPDGSGEIAAQIIATLHLKPAVTATDIAVI